jgi:hypothetical protein
MFQGTRPRRAVCVCLPDGSKGAISHPALACPALVTAARGAVQRWRGWAVPQPLCRWGQ